MRKLPDSHSSSGQRKDLVIINAAHVKGFAEAGNLFEHQVRLTAATPLWAHIGIGKRRSIKVVKEVT